MTSFKFFWRWQDGLSFGHWLSENILTIKFLDNYLFKTVYFRNLIMRLTIPPPAVRDNSGGKNQKKTFLSPNKILSIPS